MRSRNISYAGLVIFTTLMTSVTLGQNTVQLTKSKLHASVEVLRDKWGVNHIYAKNQHDLFFAQGYCAAEDRLFQFELWRRQATGTVAEIMGPKELNRDIGTRLFKFRGNLDAEFAHYHPQGRAIIEAYVEGVNAYIDEVTAKPALLPIEFQLLHIAPQKWTAEVVISRHQGLLGNITEELNIGMAVAAVGTDKVKDLMWFHPGDPVIKLDSAIDGKLLSKRILDLYYAYRKDISFEPGDAGLAAHLVSDGLNNSMAINQDISTPQQHGMEGSNNWIVSSARSADGHPLLANDPHRKIAVPSLRYMVHLVAPGWNVTGGGEPEIPGVSIGHNEHGAWGLTIFETDGEDLYVYDINPSHLNQYFYKGKWISMKEIHDTIAVKGMAPQQVVYRYTVHGPVTFIDSVHHKAYAVKCAWLEPGGAPYLASLRIDQAKDWESFRAACSYSNIPGENMIWADAKNNIGWQAVGIVPRRKNFSGLVPVPGDGRYEWQGYLPIPDRPHLENPAKGFFATANQQVTPDGYAYPDALGYTWADAFRGNRINEVLSSDNKMTIEKMQALQTDYLSLPARTLVPLLVHTTFDSGIVKQAAAQLRTWNNVMNKDSVAPAIYAMWERTLMKEANKRFVPEELRTLVGLQTTKVISWLLNPDSRFGQDPAVGRDQFLRYTFEEATDSLVARYGTSLNSWIYGQPAYKHVTLFHPLSALQQQGHVTLDIGPAIRGGSGHTVCSTGDSDNQQSGASFRMVADCGDWDKTKMINTPGQSGDPQSEFYKNLFPLWANDQYFPAYYSKSKILSNTVHRTVLSPAPAVRATQ